MSSQKCGSGFGFISYTDKKIRISDKDNKNLLDFYGEIKKVTLKAGIIDLEDKKLERKNRFVERTLAVWQPLSSRELTHEDARQIIKNTTEFFRILFEWKSKEESSSSKPIING